MKHLMLWSVCALVLFAEAVDVGDKAPAFKARNQEGAEWKLADHLGKIPIVVYFYPAAMTGGCTKQACSYRDHVAKDHPQFIVVGVSGDPVANLKQFRTAEKLNFDLLSDPSGAIAKSFGVPVKEGERSIKRVVDGKEVEFKRAVTSARWTFVIDKDGKIVYQADSVKATEDLANVLAFLAE